MKATPIAAHNTDMMVIISEICIVLSAGIEMQFDGTPCTISQRKYPVMMLFRLGVGLSASANPPRNNAKKENCF